MDLGLVHPRPSSDKPRVHVFFGLESGILQARFTVRESPVYENPSLARDSAQWGLWDWDVVELFLAVRGGGARLPYHEFQLSPLEQHFELEIHEPRKSFDTAFRSGFKFSVLKKSGSEWEASMAIPLDRLGWDGRKESVLGNAFAILGPSDRRNYLSLFTGPQETPDFHRPEDFRMLLG